MREKVKDIVFIIVGIVIGGTISVIASNIINANQVGFSSSKTSKTNLQDALDELYINTSRPERNTSMYKLEGVKAIIYLDPTDLSKNCNANNSVSTPETKTGCMKWYAFKEDDTSYTMILDHNSTSNSYYNYDNSISIGMRSASELSDIEGTTINYNEIGYDLNELTSTSHWVVTPRLITGQEVANITKNTTWLQTSNIYYFDSNSSSQIATNKGASKYSWLFDYTFNCEIRGCNIRDDKSYGYWTNDYNPNYSEIWLISYTGRFARNNASQKIYGLRPVITVLKSNL